MNVTLPDPTACAASTRVRSGEPVRGYAQRCADCGHGYVNHGSFAYCDLCRLQLQVLNLTEVLARLLDVEVPFTLPPTPVSHAPTTREDL